MLVAIQGASVVDFLALLDGFVLWNSVVPVGVPRGFFATETTARRLRIGIHNKIIQQKIGLFLVK
jgi:hypothetical protein